MMICPVKDADYIQAAIMIMENMAAKPADSKMDGDIVVRLRSCAAVEPSVRECLKAFPQWQAGEAKPAQPGQ
jgi:hypothetical protein